MAKGPDGAADEFAFSATEDPDVMLASLTKLSEADRAVMWELNKRELTRLLTAEDRDAPSDEAWDHRVNARGVLALGVGPEDVVRRVGAWVLALPTSLTDEVLRSRTESWRDGFGFATLRGFAREPEVGLMGKYWWDWWQSIRHLEHAGLLSARGTEPDYLVVLLRGLMFSGSIVDAVRADPEIADRSLWALFEPEPSVQKALLGAERFWDPTNTWRVALVRLAIEGLLDPGRLAAEAERASKDDRFGRNHRTWYRRLGALLAEPAQIPNEPRSGPPPLGSQLSGF